MRIQTNDLTEIAAFRILDMFPSKYLPEIAVQALMNGLDSPSLRRLAGELDPQESECGPLFLRVLQELSITLPNQATARLTVCRYFARMIISSQIAPNLGAHLIWSQASDALASGDEDVWELLSVFGVLSDDWEDQPDKRKAIEREIHKEAEAFLYHGTA